MFHNVFDVIMYWTFFVHVSCDNNVTFLFWFFWKDIYYVLVYNILYCAKQIATYYGYFVDNNELDIWPYVYYWIMFAYSCVFIDW